MESTIRNGTGRTVIEAYLRALAERDLAGCTELYREDAQLAFMTGVFKGRQAIEEWHRDRFAAELEVLRVEGIKVEGDKVSVDATVTSKKLRSWKIGTLSGRATFQLEGGKIKETTFGLRTSSPFEGW